MVFFSVLGDRLGQFPSGFFGCVVLMSSRGLGNACDFSRLGCQEEWVTPSCFFRVVQIVGFLSLVFNDELSTFFHLFFPSRSLFHKLSGTPGSRSESPFSFSPHPPWLEAAFVFLFFYN